jgi:nicotinamide riboside transporter PnuC
MALKKIENWTLWIIDLIVTPLYAYRGWNFVFTVFNIYNISYISLFRMEENLKQHKADIIK